MSTTTIHPFHGCPHCHHTTGPDNIYNAGRLHVGACHVHRTAWDIGSNLFSSWRDETEEEQRERYLEIEGSGTSPAGRSAGRAAISPTTSPTARSEEAAA